MNNSRSNSKRDVSVGSAFTVTDPPALIGNELTAPGILLVAVVVVDYGLAGLAVSKIRNPAVEADFAARVISLNF